MAYVPAQTLVQMNSDLTAQNGQLTALKAVRASVPTGVNPRDIELVDQQIRRVTRVIETLRLRIKRAS